LISFAACLTGAGAGVDTSWGLFLSPLGKSDISIAAAQRATSAPHAPHRQTAEFAEDARGAAGSILNTAAWLAKRGGFEPTFSTTPKTVLLATGRVGFTIADRDNFSIRRRSRRLKTWGGRT
jgi:hypothetical protein